MSNKAEQLRQLVVTMNRCGDRWERMAEEIERTGRVALPGEFQKVVASGMGAVCRAVALLAEIG